MDNSSHYEVLLAKRFTGQISVEEEAELSGWLAASDKNLAAYLKYKQAWELAGTGQALNYVLNQMDVNEKWENFKRLLPSENENEIAPLAVPLEPAWSDETGVVRKPLWKRLLVPMAVAASLFLIVVLGLKLFDRPVDAPEVVEASKDAIQFFDRHIVNDGDSIRNILLPDGSMLALSKNSEIFYREPFVNTRDIKLIGRGYFKVAKNPQMPFTVTSSELATTALGTQFEVSAFKNASTIKVKLFEGKVVVKATDVENKLMKENVYLAPGQEFVYSKLNGGVVRSFSQSAPSPAKGIADDSKQTDDPFIQDEKGSWFMFNNQSLAEVLTELSVLYEVDIKYKKSDVKSIYFTGKYSKTDSVETILQRIARLNKLTVTRNDSAYVISK